MKKMDKTETLQEAVIKAANNLPAALASNPYLPGLLISTVSNDVSDLKIAIRHFYNGNAGPLEVTRRTLTMGTALQQLKPVLGTGNLIGLVMVIIDRFNSLFNFNPSKKMNAAQIEDLAAEIVLDFLDQKRKQPITFEEIAVFFDRCGRNEFINPRTGKAFIFDRIDKSVILEIMDFYFEDKTDGRTAAVWSLEEAREAELKEQALQAETPRLSADADAFDIDQLVEGKSHLTAKGLRELHEKYGRNG